MTEPSPLRYKAIQRACTERHVGGLDPGYEDVAAGVDAALSVTRQHVERLRVAWSQNDDPRRRSRRPARTVRSRVPSPAHRAALAT